MPKRKRSVRTLLYGVGAAPGLALGPAEILAASQPDIARRELPAGEVAREIRRFRGALRCARDEIRELRASLARGADDPGDQILASHEMILQDREVSGEIVAAIKRERLDAAYVTTQILTAKAQHLSAQPNELFRGRAADVRDVARRLLSHLVGAQQTSLAQLPEGSIAVATEIPPSETAAMKPGRPAALVTARGTLTSHATILARSRGVPAVIGLGAALDSIQPGDTLIVDGERGIVIVAPSQADLSEFNATREREQRISQLTAGRESMPAVTLDGRRIAVFANVDRPTDAVVALSAGAEGIGLYRTEFFFIDAVRFPAEDEQLAAYQTVVRAFGGRTVVIRTMDLGGDKHAALMGIDHEDNPFLGLRGIRFCLAHPEFFTVQLRAILRAAAGNHVKILLPMVSHVAELRAARELIAEAQAALAREGVETPAAVPLGIMIEVPSAVFTSDALAKEADFFSIGSNDLIQYALAVDRGNERIADLYDSLDPAVLRAIAATVRGAREAGIPVASCGEMSGELPGLLLLAGLGVEELSVAPFAVTRVKEVLRRVKNADLDALAQECLRARDRQAVWDAIRAGLRSYAEFQFEKRDGRWLCRWLPPPS